MADQEYNARPYQGLITNFQLDHERCNIFAGMGLGKLQPKSEPVLTPQGWRPIGDLRVGDFVIGSDGLPTCVTGVFPQGVKRQWRVTLSDGAWTRAGDEHLWLASPPADLGRELKVVTTLFMVENEPDLWGLPKLPVEFDFLGPDYYRVRSITPDGEEDSVCISVSAPDRLYTTRHYILTHNTVSTFTACQAKVLAGQSDPILVLAPLRVAKSTWPNEVRKWRHLSGLDVMPIVGSEAERKLALRHDVPVHTCNYDNLPWLVEHYGSRWPYRTVIADECTRLKGFRLKQGGARAAALGKVAFQYAKEYIGLTGTPAPNGLADLWGQMWFVDRGQRLGRTYEAFKNRWFQRSNDGYGVDPLPFAQEQIQAAISDVCLTIRSEDWFDLDAPIVNNIYVDLPVKARVHYRELEKQMLTEINDRQVTAVNAAARTNKCLQIANGAAYLDPDADADTHPRSKEWREVHDAKLQALESIVEEANGMPVLVSYEFKSDVARIRKAFPKARMLDDNPETENEWNAGKIPILLAHPKSAGHGLNLQYGGNILVFFGHNWNLEEYQQIIERIGPVRQMQAGLNRPVYIHHIIARDTVDELVMARRETKASVQDILLEALKHKGYK